MRQVDAQVAACEAQLRAEVQAAWAELALGQSADAPAESAAPPSLHLHSSARGVGLARLLRALHKLGALESCIEQAPRARAVVAGVGVGSGSGSRSREWEWE